MHDGYAEGKLDLHRVTDIAAMVVPRKEMMARCQAKTSIRFLIIANSVSKLVKVSTVQQLQILRESRGFIIP